MHDSADDSRSHRYTHTATATGYAIRADGDAHSGGYGDGYANSDTNGVGAGVEVFWVFASCEGAMSEKSIIFSAEMIRAILDGRKTQTRRVMKPQPVSVHKSGVYHGDARHFIAHGNFSEHPTDRWIRCPYGKPGESVWVREAWRTYKSFDPYSASQIAEQCLGAGYKRPWAPIEYRDGGRTNWQRREEAGRWRSPRFMPRWASRIALRITDVRVERLQDISEEDADAEGIELDVCDQALVARDYSRKDAWFQSWSDDEGYENYVPMDELGRASFRTLWDSINGKRAPWESNPWAWAISFERVP